MTTTQTYVTNLILNAEQANNQITALERKIDELTKKRKQAETMGDTSAVAKYTKEIRKATAEMDAMKTTTQRVQKVMDNMSTAKPKELRTTIKAINRLLNDGSVERNSKEWNVLTQKLRECKTELKGIQAESQAATKGGFINKSADFLNRNWGAITQFIGGFTQLSMTVRQTTQAYADMEEAMANVRKYTGQTDEQIHQMNEEFKLIDTRTSREQLNELAGAAGRLGIQSHDEIMEFVDAADKINVALGDDLGQGAVDQIGKLAMAFGEDDKMGLRDAMLATGSAINELSANSSANAGYMVDFAARLAGVGKQAGLTQTQLYGLGSVMDENLLQDEMSSTALSQLITKMITDTKTFATMAGVPLEKFSDMVKNDMNNALLTFFDAMKSKGGFTELAPMFEKMGLSGQRATAVLSVFADKVDDVRKNQQVATDAYREATSVMDEYTVQNSTVQAQVDKAKKKFQDLSVELGEQLMPVVKYTISTGSLLVKTLSVLTSFLANHTAAIVAFSAALAAAYAKQVLMNNATKISMALDTAHNALLYAKGVAVAVLTGKVSLLTVAQHCLNAAMRAFPAVFFATAIAGIVTALTTLAKKIKETKKEASDTAAEDLRQLNTRQELNTRLIKLLKEYNQHVKEHNRLLEKRKVAVANGFQTDGWDDQIRKSKKALNERLKVIKDYRAKVAALDKKPASSGTTPDTTPTTEGIEAGTVPAKASGGTADDPMKAALERSKKQAQQLLMVETNRYDQGLTNLRQYTEKQKEINLAAMDEQLSIMRQYGQTETDEYKELQLQRQAEQIKDDNKLRDISLEDLERQHQAQAALIKAQLTDRTSELYGNEEAVNEALFQNDMAYLEKKRDMYKETSDDWADTDAEIQQKLNDHRLEKEQAYHERLQQLKDHYIEVDQSALMSKELATLDEFHAASELSEEQYQQALMAIREKYATHQPTADERTRSNASTALSAAERQAGGFQQYDTGGADMGVTSFAGIFQIVKYRQQVNENLKQLYGEDYENSAEYNEAKRQNNQAMLDEIVSAAQAAYSGISQIMSAASAYSQACADLETAKITAEYDKQIEAAGSNSTKKEKLEKERDKKIAAAKTKANKKAMTIEVAQAVASTAMAAINAYASASKVSWVLGPIAAAAATAAGMLQIATIKKQHEAEQAGYYEGGFTSGRSYRRQAGVVHEGEFVANHNAVNNRAILPALQLIDQAQRENTVSSLTAADVSRALGTGDSTAVVAPVVNVQTDNAELNRAIGDVATVVDSLNTILSQGINAKVGLDGPDGFDAQYRKYKRLKGN